MTKYKAEKTGFVMRDKHMDVVEYKYRGRLYEVTHAKDWTMSITPAWVQHRDAQAKIDEELDKPKKTDAKPITLDDIYREYGWE